MNILTPGLALCAVIAGILHTNRARGADAIASPARATAASNSAASSDDRFQLSSLLPPALAKDMDIYAWGWIAGTHNSSDDDNTFSDVDLALGVTRRIGDRLAVSADMHFFDAADHPRGFLEQAFVTAELSEQDGHPSTLLTLGKFNASIGVEPRDSWDRLTGTPSLLFAAEPQDFVGVMVTQSLGDSNIRLRPFVTSCFEGRSDFTGPPSAGMAVDYKPDRTLSVSVTNWFGPGFRQPAGDVVSAARTADYEPSGYYYPSAPSADSYSESGYSYDYTARSWLGPDFDANRGGSLYFLDANVTWMPRPDLTIEAEALLAANGASAGHLAWGGALVLANFDITDRLRVFGRWSYLADPQGLVTGQEQRRHELSGGFGLAIIHGVEFRAEYRHDFSVDAGDLDSVSAHLSFSF